MAVGEYISVSSQRDSEMADVEKERVEQAKGAPKFLHPYAPPSNILCSAHMSMVWIGRTRIRTNICEMNECATSVWRQGLYIFCHGAGPEARARELLELQAIYMDRGIERELARQVAVQLTEKDVIRAHARDELGMPTLHCDRIGLFVVN